MPHCLLLLLCATLSLLTAGEPLVRDPAHWPFSADSPWNMPIGDEAEYAPVDAPEWQSVFRYGVLLNSQRYTHPIFIASPDDQVRSFFNRQGQEVVRMPVPDAAAPGDDLDLHLHVIDPDRTFVVELWHARRRPDGNWEGDACLKNDLCGPGVYDKHHGARAYGGSAIGGLIRRGELTTGIRHALAIAVRGESLNRRTPDGGRARWPAVSNADCKATRGNLHMGSLLAIPPDVDLDTLGLPEGPTMVLARALQQYGAYVVDRGYLNLYAEPAAHEEVQQVDRQALTRAVRLLQIVANNGPDAVGGGGRPCRPLAPPFGDPEAAARALAQRRQRTAERGQREPLRPGPTVDQAAVERWTALLLEQLVQAVADGQRPELPLARLGGRLAVVEAVDDQNVTIAADGLRMPLPWSSFSAVEHLALAQDLSRRGHQTATAAAAVLAWSGQQRDVAMSEFARLGDPELRREALAACGLE